MSINQETFLQQIDCVLYWPRTAFDLSEEVLPQKCTENKIINYKVVTTFRSAGIKKKFGTL